MTAILTAPGDCPKCASTGFPNPGELAAHLIDAHDMTGSAALALARQTVGEIRAANVHHADIGKEGLGPMGKSEDRTGECSECHRLRHHKSCSQHFRHGGKLAPTAPTVAPREKKHTGRCGYCRRQRPDHSENCRRKGPGAGAKKRRPITRRHPLPPKRKVAASNGHGLLSELDALRVIAAALEPLGAESQGNVLGCVCRLLAIAPSKLAS